MENQEKILDVLTSFEKTPSKDIPPVLEDYLRTVAKTGKTVFPWNRLKMLFVQKLEQVMEQFNMEDPCSRQTPFPNVENTKYEEMRQRIVEAVQRFTGAPFTVQRICELVTQPKKHYTQCDKFLRGIEKNVMVVSTVDPYGRKIVSESRSLVNGLDVNGVGQQSDMNDITDGQPFGALPSSDWSPEGVATVWPVTVQAENANNSNVNTELAEKSAAFIEGNMNAVKEESEGIIHKEDIEIGKDLVEKDSVVSDGVPLSVKLSPSLPSDIENKSIEDSVPEQNKENNLQPNESANNISQQSNMTLDNKMSENLDSPPNASSCIENNEEAELDSSELGVKHTRDETEVNSDEPPEKKQKLDTIESERQTSDTVTDETTTPDPDTTEESSHNSLQTTEELKIHDDAEREVQSKSADSTTASENTDSESATVTDTDKSTEEIEASAYTSAITETSQVQTDSITQSEIPCTNQIESGTDKNQSEAPASQSAPEPDQSDNSSQKIPAESDCEKSDELVTEQGVSEDTSLAIAELPTTTVDTIHDKSGISAGETDSEKIEDSSSETEVMETDTVPEDVVLNNTETAVQENQSSVDESEPMDQE